MRGIKHNVNRAAKQLAILPTYHLFISRLLSLPLWQKLSCIYHGHSHIFIVAFFNPRNTSGKITNSEKHSICKQRKFLSYEANVFTVSVCNTHSFQDVQLVRYCPSVPYQTVLPIVFKTGRYIQCLASVGRVYVKMANFSAFIQV